MLTIFNIGFSEGIILLVMLFIYFYFIAEVMRSGKPTTEKLLWVLIILVANLLGVIIYLLFGREKGKTRF